MMNVPTTRVPTGGPATPSPSAATVPEISCPSTAGTGNATSPFSTCRSVWQTPHAATRTSISPRRGCGTGIRSIASGCPSSGSTAANIDSGTVTPPLRRPRSRRRASTASRDSSNTRCPTPGRILVSASGSRRPRSPPARPGSGCPRRPRRRASASSPGAATARASGRTAASTRSAQTTSTRDTRSDEKLGRGRHLDAGEDRRVGGEHRHHLFVRDAEEVDRRMLARPRARTAPQARAGTPAAAAAIARSDGEVAAEGMARPVRPDRGRGGRTGRGSAGRSPEKWSMRGVVGGGAETRDGAARSGAPVRRAAAGCRSRARCRRRAGRRAARPRPR